MTSVLFGSSLVSCVRVPDISAWDRGHGGRPFLGLCCLLSIHYVGIEDVFLLCDGRLGVLHVHGAGEWRAFGLERQKRTTIGSC